MNPGMGAYIVLYYRKKSPQDTFVPRSTFALVQVLDFTDPSPFMMFGDVLAGCSRYALCNGLFRAPLFPHKPANSISLFVDNVYWECMISRVSLSNLSHMLNSLETTWKCPSHARRTRIPFSRSPRPPFPPSQFVLPPASPSSRLPPLQQGPHFTGQWQFPQEAQNWKVAYVVPAILGGKY